jgi:hypothetical protein
LSRAGQGFDLAFAAFVMVSVFTSQWAWEHYKLIYVFPLAILVSELVGIVRRRRPWWLAALATSAILFAGIEMQISPWIKTSTRANASFFRSRLLEVTNWAPTALMVIAFGFLLFDRTREVGQLELAAGEGQSRR